MNEFADLMARGGFSFEQVAEELGVRDRQVRRYASGETPARPRDIRVLKGLLLAGVKPVRQTPAASFKFIDLFAGIGGLRLGFEAIGGECVFTSEWAKLPPKRFR